MRKAEALPNSIIANRPSRLVSHSPKGQPFHWTALSPWWGQRCFRFWKFGKIQSGSTDRAPSSSGFGWVKCPAWRFGSCAKLPRTGTNPAWFLLLLAWSIWEISFNCCYCLWYYCPPIILPSTLQVIFQSFPPPKSRTGYCGESPKSFCVWINKVY